MLPQQTLRCLPASAGARWCGLSEPEHGVMLLKLLLPLLYLPVDIGQPGGSLLLLRVVAAEASNSVDPTAR